MPFIDEIEIHVRAGKGGDGVVRWRREKFKPKGGPGGGNGGRGGDVIAEAVHDLAYLEYYRHKKDFHAEDGEAGGNMGKEGKNGEPLVLKFPVGSILTNLMTQEQISLDAIGQQVTILKGGKGGFGNEHFKASTNTTPYESTPGTMGGEADFTVELQLFADIGFVGLPNAGKSTALNMLTNAESKVGAYPFTTLEPSLGDLHGYILADIPGLIEGASRGKGLGHKFLRHIKRTKMLAHFISLENENIATVYTEIRKELEDYDGDLAEKPEVIVLSKTDLVDAETLEKKKKEIAQVAPDRTIFTLSAYDSESTKNLGDSFVKLLREQGK